MYRLNLQQQQKTKKTLTYHCELERAGLVVNVRKVTAKHVSYYFLSASLHLLVPPREVITSCEVCSSRSSFVYTSGVSLI